MTTTGSQERDAGLQAFALRAALTGALGAALGVVFDLGSRLTGSAGAAAAGAVAGFAIASGLYIASALTTVHRLRDRVDQLETRDQLTGLPNGRALRAWLDRHLPHANEVQSHTACW